MFSSQVLITALDLLFFCVIPILVNPETGVKVFEVKAEDHHDNHDDLTLLTHGHVTGDNQSEAELTVAGPMRGRGLLS